MFRRLIASFVCLAFSFTNLQYVQAQEFSINQLPVPGTMVSVSAAFEPALIKGLTVHKDNPFLFDFIVDPGQSKLSQEELKEESDRMIKYFFASLTIPDRDIWVNLSPYEKDRMIPESLGETAMGRDLLAQDYMLKQLTASLIYPQQALGKEFWAKVYAQAKAKYGTTEIPVNTFNKVWIVPQRVGIYEHGQTAFIVDGHLKVMLEEDYLSLTKHNAISINSIRDSSATPQNDMHTLSSQIIRSIILPEIEKEVNEDKNFATLRQIFYAQALAVWFKRNLKQALLNRVYANKGTVKGIDQNNPTTNEAIYQQYLRAYKKGVFNYIKEDIDPITQETLPRKYFSGGYEGVLPNILTPAMVTEAEEKQVEAHDVDVSDFVTISRTMQAALEKSSVLASAAVTGGVINFNTPSPQVAAYFSNLGLPVSASSNPNVIIIDGQRINLKNPRAFYEAFNRELLSVGPNVSGEASPENNAMLADWMNWAILFGANSTGLYILKKAITKSTEDFQAAKSTDDLDQKLDHYKELRKDGQHIAGGITVAATWLILAPILGVNIHSIKLDLIAGCAASKIAGGVFGFERMADEYIAATEKAIKAEGEAKTVAIQELKDLENHKGNPWRKFFFERTDIPMLKVLFFVSLFPNSWDISAVQHWVNAHHILSWFAPLLPFGVGFGGGTFGAKVLDKKRPTHNGDLGGDYGYEHGDTAMKALDSNNDVPIQKSANPELVKSMPPISEFITTSPESYTSPIEFTNGYKLLIQEFTGGFINYELQNSKGDVVANFTYKAKPRGINTVLKNIIDSSAAMKATTHTILQPNEYAPIRSKNGDKFLVYFGQGQKGFYIDMRLGPARSQGGEPFTINLGSAQDVKVGVHKDILLYLVNGVLKFEYLMNGELSDVGKYLKNFKPDIEIFFDGDSIKVSDIRETAKGNIELKGQAGSHIDLNLKDFSDYLEKRLGQPSHAMTALFDYNVHGQRVRPEGSLRITDEMMETELLEFINEQKRYGMSAYLYSLALATEDNNLNYQSLKGLIQENPQGVFNEFVDPLLRGSLDFKPGVRQRWLAFLARAVQDAAMTGQSFRDFMLKPRSTIQLTVASLAVVGLVVGGIWGYKAYFDHQSQKANSKENPAERRLLEQLVVANARQKVQVPGTTNVYYKWGFGTNRWFKIEKEGSNYTEVYMPSDFIPLPADQMLTKADAMRYPGIPVKKDKDPNNPGHYILFYKQGTNWIPAPSPNASTNQPSTNAPTSNTNATLLLNMNAPLIPETSSILKPNILTRAQAQEVLGIDKNGGIDLSQQGSALHITKDANGGVEVNVDPAMIARVEREGMSEIDPVIIGMRPADTESLFGVKVLTSTP